MYQKCAPGVAVVSAVNTSDSWCVPKFCTRVVWGGGEGGVGVHRGVGGGVHQSLRGWEQLGCTRVMHQESVSGVVHPRMFRQWWWPKGREVGWPNGRYRRYFQICKAMRTNMLLLILDELETS